MIDNVILTTENCRYCLMCRHVCPVGHVTRKETLTPHGWGMTIASLKRGLISLDEESVQTIYSCADCGTCRANCVTDQPLPAAISAMRKEIVDKNLAPQVVERLKAQLSRWRNPHREVAPGPTKGEGEVALFVGDDARYLDEETLSSSLALLDAVGTKPILVGVGRNNGYLAASLGLQTLASELIQETLEEVEQYGVRKMLVLSPGDYYVFNQMSHERLGIEWPAEVELQEVITLLEEHFASGSLTLAQSSAGIPAAYIDPTHSVRVPGRFEAPRVLLSAVTGSSPVELFWRRERTHPCGNVALQYTDPHLSNHLTYSRLADARQSGAQLLATDDPGSLFHLRRHAGQFGLEIESLYTILAQNLA